LCSFVTEILLSTFEIINLKQKTLKKYVHAAIKLESYSFLQRCRPVTNIAQSQTRLPLKFQAHSVEQSHTPHHKLTRMLE
jgi:hypothetical protein